MVTVVAPGAGVNAKAREAGKSRGNVPVPAPGGQPSDHLQDGPTRSAADTPRRQASGAWEEAPCSQSTQPQQVEATISRGGWGPLARTTLSNKCDRVCSHQVPQRLVISTARDSHPSPSLSLATLSCKFPSRTSVCSSGLVVEPGYCVYDWLSTPW